MINRAAIAGLIGVSAPMVVIIGFWLMGWSALVSYFLALAVMGIGVTVAITGGMSRARVEKNGLEVDAARFLLTPELQDHGARAEAAFRADDPTFTRAGLLTMAELLAQRLGAADLSAIHPFVSDGLFQRLSAQQRMGSLPSEFTSFSQLQVKGSMVAEFAVGAQYQSVQLRLTLGEGAQLRSVALSLLRRRQAHRSAEGLAGGKCPQCGAPLELTATQRCRFCEAIVNSGEHDWVLVALTPGAQTLSRQGDVLDPEQVLARDPSLAAEELVDRASLIFWRWIEARQGAVVGRLTRVASPQFIEQLELTPRPTGPVTHGGAELRTLRSVSGFDEAHLAVRWADASNGEPRSHHSVFKLRRPHGKQTPSAMGLSTLRCTTCLAALTDAESSQCEYCEAPLQDAWCLHDIEPYSTWVEGATALRKTVGGDWLRAATLTQREAAMALLVSLAQADGVLDEAERGRLQAISEKWQIPPGRLDALLSASVSAARPTLSRELALSLTQELVNFAFVEARLGTPERKRLEAIARALGMESELERQLAQRTAARLDTRA